MIAQRGVGISRGRLFKCRRLSSALCVPRLDETRMTPYFYRLLALGFGDLQIRVLRFRREKPIGHTVRANGQRDMHYTDVVICWRCVVWEKVRKFFKFLWAKAKVMAPDAALIILAALMLAWFFETIDLRSLLSLGARSQETDAVYRKLDFPPATAIAPTVTEPRLILISPGE
jgi:hypothetical protein